MRGARRHRISTTEALPALAEALSALGIDPHSVEVSLQVADWKALDRQLAQEHADGLLQGGALRGDVRLTQLGIKRPETKRVRLRFIQSRRSRSYKKKSPPCGWRAIWKSLALDAPAGTPLHELPRLANVPAG